MAYVVPQALIYQDIDLAAAPNAQPLNAHVSGGHAHLLRYAESDEKPDGLLGYYDRLTETCYEWPQRPAGATIDPDYTKVFIDNALLLYFADTIGSGETISSVAGKTNRVRCGTLAFKTNDAADHSAVFEDRGVRVGDVAKLRFVVGGDTYTLWTYISGFVAEVVAASVGSASRDTANATTQVLSSAGDQTDGPENCVEIDSIDDSAYDGLLNGNITETYTITVLESSAGGDATTALLRVTSASGDDDVAEVTPEAFGDPTPIGNNGLTVTFDNAAGGSCSLSADNDGVSADDFAVGQVFEVSVSQAFTRPNPTSAGTYTGAETVTYIAEVTKGGTSTGDEDTAPELTITTDKGIDTSGPTKVVTSGDSIAIGTGGVTMTLNQAALRKGDKYLIVATAASDGPLRTLVLGNNLPQAVIDNGSTECDLSLFIRANVEVNENRFGEAPLTNWTQEDTQLCVADGITALDDTWTVDGEQEALPIYSESSKSWGKVYVEYRAWLSTLCNTVLSASSPEELDDVISGPLHPDNVLKYGWFKALQNSNGNLVTATSVCDPADPDSWLTVLDKIDGRRDSYGLVPLTRNATVFSAYQAHCNAQSSATIGRWRVAWFNLEGVDELAIVDAAVSTDEELVMATLADDPDASGTQYTLLSVPEANGAFLANGVRPNDVVRFLYTTDGFGNSSYTEFVVDEVISEDSLRLLHGHTVPITTPQKIEIWRNLTATEQAEAIGAQGGFSDRRVRQVWPDTIEADGYTVQGYHLCAALAGLASGVAPQQSLTRVEIAGFTAVPRTTRDYGRAQLDRMAENGVWIVTQDTASGQVFTRHALTTAPYEDIDLREESITRNFDSISYYFLDVYSPYIGVANVVDGMVDILQAETRAAITVLKNRFFTPRLGGQLKDGSIIEIRPHSTIKDRILVSLSLQLPFALNNIENHLLI